MGGEEISRLQPKDDCLRREKRKGGAKLHDAAAWTMDGAK
jgi:hypothetical protein